MARTLASERAAQTATKKSGLSTRSANTVNSNGAGRSTKETRETRTCTRTDRLTYEASNESNKENLELRDCLLSVPRDGGEQRDPTIAKTSYTWAIPEVLRLPSP